MVTRNLISNFFKYFFNVLNPAEKLRSLVDLTKTLSSSSLLNLDGQFMNQVIEKLLHMIAAIKAFSQAGACLNKNCLLTANNLAHRMKEVEIEKKYLKLLSGLGGHADFEIRTCAWSILLKISTKLGGAHQLIEGESVFAQTQLNFLCENWLLGLFYLPGGFHACCISTLIDKTEVNIVRETAGALFANLISFGKFEEGLHAAVFPRCAENVRF